MSNCACGHDHGASHDHLSDEDLTRLGLTRADADAIRAHHHHLKVTVTETGQFAASLQGVDAGQILCFSMLVPTIAVEGCEVFESVGGYTALKVLTPDHFVFAYFTDEFTPQNRGWLPYGAYLRGADGTTADVHVLTDVDDMAVPKVLSDGPMMAGLPVVPRPTSWAPAEGILLTRGGLAAIGDFADAIAGANALADRCKLPNVDGGAVPLRVSHDADLGAESYRLTIAEGGIDLAAGDGAGAFYGAVTLIQLQFHTRGRLACGVITDTPRFEWRGQSMDCARHFYQTDTLLRLLDMMALFKLNRFHWRFNDDETFRFEINAFPELAQTHYRGEGQLVPAIFGAGAGPTGGCYTRADAQALIDRAATMMIEVMPEVEIPTHGYALTRLFPDLLDPDDPGQDPSVQGYTKNAMNPAMPFTWEFIDTVLGELAEVFPFGHIHLGCDEPPAGMWSNSPKAQALMAREGLATEDDLNGWMMARIAADLRAKGITPCAWEEAARGSNGGIGNGAILFSWTEQGPGLEAARRGYDVVMSPAQNLYFDMSYTDEFHDWGAKWAGACSIADTVDWDPVPADEPELEARIKGVQSTYWSEFTVDDAQMESMLAPRILGTAETAWRAPRDKATVAEAEAAARQFSAFFDRIGWDSRV